MPNGTHRKTVKTVQKPINFTLEGVLREGGGAAWSFLEIALGKELKMSPTLFSANPTRVRRRWCIRESISAAPEVQIVRLHHSSDKGHRGIYARVSPTAAKFLQKTQNFNCGDLVSL